MARQDLLNGAYHGGLGGTVGFKHRDKKVLRMKANHIVHIGQKQRRAVRAFEVLNRVSSIIAKNLYQYMGLKSNTMLKHNQIAQLLKATVQGGTFDISKIGEVFQPTGENTIETLFADISTALVRVVALTSEPVETDPSKKVFLFLIDQLGHSIYSQFIATQRTEVEFLYPLEQGLQTFAVMLTVDTSGQKPIYKGFTYKAQDPLPVVENGIIYFSRMRNVKTQITAPHKIATNGRGIAYVKPNLVYQDVP